MKLLCKVLSIGAGILGIAISALWQEILGVVDIVSAFKVTPTSSGRVAYDVLCRCMVFPALTGLAIGIIFIILIPLLLGHPTKWLKRRGSEKRAQATD